MIGKNIKKERNLKKLSLRALAEKASISKSTLSDIENDKTSPTFNTLQKVADALGIPVDYLTRKSVKAVIEDKLEELNMTFKELSDRTKIPMIFFENIDNIIPDESDYEKLKQIANTLDMDESILFNALSKQEPPVYEGISSRAEDDFIIKEESSSYYTDEFSDPESAMAFLIKQPSLAAYGGYDPKTMSDEEIVEFANELLRQLKLLGFKYKK